MVYGGSSYATLYDECSTLMYVYGCAYVCVWLYGTLTLLQFFKGWWHKEKYKS